VLFNVEASSKPSSVVALILKAKGTFGVVVEVVCKGDFSFSCPSTGVVFLNIPFYIKVIPLELHAG
jgi:hypothetical protein